MKDLIARLDRVSGDLEDINHPSTLHLVWQIDRVAQELVDRLDNIVKMEKLASLKHEVLNTYLNNITLLCKTDNKLKSLINKQSPKNAEKIYEALKSSFSKMNRKSSIKFIKNILKDSK